MDKKRLIGETVPKITQGEIDAWNRGKGDAVKDKILAATRTLSVKRAISLVKMFAQLGDIHFLATRFDVPVDEVRRILHTFDIYSIEDAKKIVTNGIIAEYDSAVTNNLEERAAQNVIDHAVASERLVEQQKNLEPQVKSQEEIDHALAARREVAQRKNKEDQLRQLISEGIDPKTGKSNFRIPLSKIREFKQLIPYGVGQLQRRFGGSGAEIVSEIKRLAPEIDIDMLRP